MGHRLVTGILLLATACTAGCGPRTPENFTVSGQGIEFWVPLLKSRDLDRRREAVRHLGNVGPPAPDAIPALTESLGDADPRVRSDATFALLKSGSAAASALPALKRLADDPDPSVRKNAARAAEVIGGR